MVATIIERVDDIFNAPSSNVLVHACNCRGAWGAGVAKEFKKRFPAAFKVYQDHCKSKAPEDIVGTTLLIHESTHRIACLFTSRDFGKRVDPIELILVQTEQSVTDLKRQIEDLKKADSSQVGSVWSVRINVGYFKVPWSRTLEVLKDCELDMTVVRREEDDVGVEEGEIAGKINKPKKSKSAKSFEDPKSIEHRKSVGRKKPAATTKSTEAKANESRKLSESKPSELNDSSEPKKTPRKPPAKKADKPKPKAKAPPKGILKTDRVLRPRKPKPKVVEVDNEPALKKVVKKSTKTSLKTTTKTPIKATTKTAAKATPKITIKKKAPPKKAAGKLKEKEAVAGASVLPSLDTIFKQRASRNQRSQGEKRKRNEATPTPSAKRTRKQLL